MSNPFRYFNSSPEVIRLVVMMYVRYPLSLRNVEDLLVERGINISHETVRFRWNRVLAQCSPPKSARDASRICAAILSDAGIWMRSL
jgi:transposase-like protein